MNRIVCALPILALSLGGATACATKGFVRSRVGEVNDKVETLSKSVEENQERIRQTEGRVTEVDNRVTQVDQKAQAANQAAAAAGQSAQQARSTADAAGARAEAVDLAVRRLIYEVVLSEEKAKFKFGQAALPQEAAAELDKLVDQLKADPKAYFIEIEGHTDNAGSKMVNERLGLERAEAVKRYLYEQHQVPLHKINVISYGEDKPVAPNNTRDGRSQNRRVVVKVLA